MEQTQFEKNLAELKASTGAIKYGQLALFSGMRADQLARFKDAWRGIDAHRRHQIISRMVALAEEDVELNFDGVFENCLSDPDERVREKAIEGLWEYHGVSVVKQLVRILREDRAEAVRAAAATGLARFALMAELQELHPSYLSLITSTLLASFKNPKEGLEVRRRALEALAPVTLPEVAAAIREAYGSTDSKLKAGAIYAMGQNCDPEWLPLLLQELRSDSADLRFEAAGACGECGEEECVPHLAALLRDDDVQVRLAAIDSLGRIGGQKARSALTRCMKSCEDEEVRLAASEALEEIKLTEKPFSFGRQ